MKKIILSIAMIIGFFMVTAAKAEDPAEYEHNKGGSGAVLPDDEAHCADVPGQCNLYARDNRRDGYLLERNIQSQNARRASRVADILNGKEGQGPSDTGSSGSATGEE